LRMRQIFPALQICPNNTEAQHFYCSSSMLVALWKIRSFGDPDNDPATWSIRNWVGAPKTVPKTKGFGRSETIRNRRTASEVPKPLVSAAGRSGPSVRPWNQLFRNRSSVSRTVSDLTKPFYFGSGFGNIYPVPDTLGFGSAIRAPETSDFPECW
jgi:hypothetical protein